MNVTNLSSKLFSLNANCKQMPFQFCSANEVKSKLMFVQKFGFIGVETSNITVFVIQVSAEFGVWKFYCL